MEMNLRKSNGLKEGLAIGLGYFAVAFAFGIFTTENGISPLVAGLISFTNLSSTGQFAGVNLMLRGASYLELALTVLLINLRYFLMSMSLSQNWSPIFRSGNVCSSPKESPMRFLRSG